MARSICPRGQIEQCAFADPTSYVAVAAATVPVSCFSTTETSGSSQKAQINDPMTSRLAATMNGACHDPYWTRTPKTKGDSAPPMFPAMFIMPETVPENLPPTSIGTDHEGPMVHSRKNIAPVRQKTAT